MRTYYLVLLGMLAVQITNAQSPTKNEQADWLGKGQLNVGVRVGQGYKGTYPITSSVTPQIQYFIADRWSVSAEGRYLTSSIYSNQDYRFLGGGLSTRYYVVRTSRFAVFAYAGAVYGKSSIQVDKRSPDYLGAKSNTRQVDAGLGVQYRLSRRVSVEAMGCRSWLNNSSETYGLFQPPTSFNRWQVSIGVNYRIR